VDSESCGVITVVLVPRLPEYFEERRNRENIF
jgi:hypothetical protein